jgi:hypothetical protein
MLPLFYIFLVVIGLIAVALYWVLFTREVPGFREQRFGTLEELPDDLGKWRDDDDSDEAKAAHGKGLKRQERYLFDSDKNKLVYQVRFRDRESNEIVGIEPDVVVKRRRVKAKSA